MKMWINKIKAYTETHKKVVIITAVAILMMIIGIVIASVVKQSTVENRIKEDLDGYCYKYRIRWEEKTEYKFLFFKAGTVDEFFVMVYDDGRISWDTHEYEAFKVKTSLFSSEVKLLTKGTSGDWYTTAVAEPGENGSYVLNDQNRDNEYRLEQDESYQKISFEDAEALIVQLKCEHKNVKTVVKNNIAERSCSDCGKEWTETWTAKKALMSVEEFGEWYQDAWEVRLLSLKPVEGSSLPCLLTNTGKGSPEEYQKVFMISEETVLYSGDGDKCVYTPGADGTSIILVQNSDWSSMNNAVWEALAPLNGYGADQGLTIEAITKAFEEGATKHDDGTRTFSNTVAGVKYSITRYSVTRPGGTIITLFLED